MDNSITQALTAPFAAGFVGQRFLDIFDAPISKILSDSTWEKARSVKR